jgi:hypothetical protein
MRWLILLLNILAAAAFLLVGIVGGGKSRSFVHSIHREMETQGMIKIHYSESGKETPDVRAQLMKIARANFQSGLCVSGAIACLLNGMIYFFSFPSRRDNAPKQSATSSPQTYPAVPPSD